MMCGFVGLYFHRKWNRHFKNTIMSFYSAARTLIYNNNLLQRIIANVDKLTECHIVTINSGWHRYWLRFLLISLVLAFERRNLGIYLELPTCCLILDQRNPLPCR